MSEKELSFEEKLQKIEDLVQKMEQGNLSLDEQLADFELGVSLIKSCEENLKQAEGKVKKLMKTDNGMESAPNFADFNY